MIKNGKFFLPPPKDGSDLKDLFKQLVAAGAGRPLGSDGFPSGPWTPELLSEAISQIDSNHAGVDLRTTQLWFQENERGISAGNIRWLARVFGCDDPEATSEWQVELSTARARLSAKRREAKRAENDPIQTPLEPTPATLGAGDATSSSEQGSDPIKQKPFRGLASRSEALFSQGSSLDLAALVFAGAAALGFLSYIVGIHNATYVRPDGVVKQVGFLWAPNWTFLFMVLLPLFFALVSELLVFWKDEGREKLLLYRGETECANDWSRIVEAYSHSYWAVFVICVLFAGVFQWIGVCLIPLLERSDDYATSWGTLAIVRPEVISVAMSIFFTALAYLYMSLFFYLFFAGLILLYTVVHDLWKMGEVLRPLQETGYQPEFDEVGLRVMGGVFRCTILGILIAICMKAQSSYVTSSAQDIVTWFVNDMSSVLLEHRDLGGRLKYRMPTHYSSLLVAVSTCAVFLYGLIRLGVDSRFQMPLWKMSAAIVLLIAGYLLTGMIAGFSILLSFGAVIATYGLVDPSFGRVRASEIRKP